MRDDRAVSPVIGIVLMVAITVVLATTVFFLVNDLGETTGPPPEASFQNDRSGTGGEVQVIALGNVPIDVEGLRIEPEDCVLRALSGVAKTTGELSAGDYVDCDSDGDVIIVDDTTGTLLWRGTV